MPIVNTPQPPHSVSRVAYWQASPRREHEVVVEAEFCGAPAALVQPSGNDGDTSVELTLRHQPVQNHLLILHQLPATLPHAALEARHAASRCDKWRDSVWGAACRMLLRPHPPRSRRGRRRPGLLALRFVQDPVSTPAPERAEAAPPAPGAQEEDALGSPEPRSQAHARAAGPQQVASLRPRHQQGSRRRRKQQRSQVAPSRHVLEGGSNGAGGVPCLEGGSNGAVGQYQRR
jgi:hypothetical protein